MVSEPVRAKTAKEKDQKSINTLFMIGGIVFAVGLFGLALGNPGIAFLGLAIGIGICGGAALSRVMM
jgi:hypothetical protein